MVVPLEEYTTEEIDTRFALLDHYERRCIVHFLQETEDGRAPLADVVSHLTKQDPTPSDPDSIEATLQHNHLPRLASTDVFEFDPRSATVRYHGDDLIDALLDVTPEPHIPGP